MSNSGTPKEGANGQPNLDASAQDNKLLTAAEKTEEVEKINEKVNSNAEKTNSKLNSEKAGPSYARYMVNGASLFFIGLNIYLFALVWPDNILDAIYGEKATYLALSIMFLLYGAVFGFFLATMVTAVSAYKAKEQKAESLLSEADQKVNDLVEKDFNLRILERNFKQLSAYYQESLAQSSKSFISASTMCFLGFSLLAVGIVLMFFGETESAYITAVSGVLAEFIALTIFKVFKESINKASDYHKKLLISQNMAMGIQMAKDVDDQKIKNELNTEIVKALIQDSNKYISA